MKNFFSLLAVGVFCLSFSSCTVVRHPVGGEGCEHHQKNTHQQRVVGGENNQAHQVGERCYVKIGADCSNQSITQAVESAAAAEVQSLFAKSCFAANGNKGVWSTPREVEGVVQGLFAAKGYKLTPGAEGAPGHFKVMEYRFGLPPQ
jgi:hypothetical protein